MVALWGLLATSLNVTMRWLKRPMSYWAGVRLGAARFIDAGAALTTLAISWALLMPAMVWLATRFDGVSDGAPHG